MTISDQSRHLLHQRLEEVLGSDEAATVMEHLAPVGWADVATKRDLDHVRVHTERLGVELRAEIDQMGALIRSEMTVGFAGVAAGLADLRTELHKEIGSVRADMARQLPTLFVGLVGSQISAGGLALAMSRLL